jgi:F-box and WD-40 domain protein CDC4
MDNSIRIWDLETKTCAHVCEGHTSLVGLLALTPSRLISASADATMRIWDAGTGELRYSLTGHTGAITCIAADENVVLSGSDSVLKVWDARTGTEIIEALSGVVGVWQVAFQGRLCAAASSYHDGDTCLDIWKLSA